MMNDPMDILLAATQTFDLNGATDAESLFARAQEHAAAVYTKHGHLPSMVVLVSTTLGRPLMHVTDVDVYQSFFPDSEIAKMAMMRSVRRLAREIDAYLYIAVLNAWSASASSGENLEDGLRRYGSIEKMPNAVDSLVFLMESRSGAKMATIKVQRGSSAETVSLSNPEVVEGVSFGGVMTGVISALNPEELN